METEFSRNLMSSSVYDTACVAKVLAKQDLFDWVLKNQKPDGSWGSQVNLCHDRILNTYGAIQALKTYKYGEDAVERGRNYIKTNMPYLKDDRAGTFGFEFIAPEIIDELHLNLPELKNHFEKTRQAKLMRIPKESFSTMGSTILHYAEFLRAAIPLEAVSYFSNATSLICSPSATAWLYEKNKNARQKKYLESCISDSSVPTLFPIEIFGSAWIFYNSLLVSRPDTDELNFLESIWNSDGMPLSASFPIVDLDSTAMCFKALYGVKPEVQPEVFDQFEADEYFVCYKNERVPSVGANIHMLDAIKGVDSEKTNRWKQKIVEYLKREIVEDSYWLDKWHLSPYYITSHAITALSEVDNELMSKAIDWMLKTQKADGSWGTYLEGTCEETAYCILGLHSSKGTNEEINESKLKGIDYLKRQFHNYSYPELWVGKVLYSHIGVVKSAIECAIKVGEEITR